MARASRDGGWSSLRYPSRSSGASVASVQSIMSPISSLFQPRNHKTASKGRRKHPLLNSVDRRLLEDRKERPPSCLSAAVGSDCRFDDHDPRRVSQKPVGDRACPFGVRGACGSGVQLGRRSSSTSGDWPCRRSGPARRRGDEARSSEMTAATAYRLGHSCGGAGAKINSGEFGRGPRL
jgi:hypothetical protein